MESLLECNIFFQNMTTMQRILFGSRDVPVTYKAEKINIHQIHDRFVTWIYKIQHCCNSICKHDHEDGEHCHEHDHHKETFKHLPPLILVKQIPHILRDNNQQSIKSEVHSREMQTLNVLVQQNKFGDQLYHNPLLHVIEGDKDTWMIYDFIYAPPKTLVKGINVPPKNPEKCYFQCLDKSLFKMSITEMREKKLNVVNHNTFYKTIATPNKEQNRKVFQQLIAGICNCLISMHQKQIVHGNINRQNIDIQWS